jgi:ribosomal protein L11 methyltransferase
MAWLQVRIACRASDTSEREDALLAAGALAVTYLDAADQPVLEPGVGEMPLWDEVVLVGLFAASIDTDAALALLSNPNDRLPARAELLEDKDWEREWMQHYAPMLFGDRLWICPSWLPPPDPSAVNILLDPGLAFGTGTHPTTAMCLEALASLDLQAATVIDYGCGSGILAIAAARLGAARVLAWTTTRRPWWPAAAMLIATGSAQRH